MNAIFFGKSIRLRINFTVPVTLFVVFFISSCTFFGDDKPDESRFVAEVLAENLDEPLGMTFLPGDQVLFVERKGGLKLYDPVLDSVKTIAILPVNHSVSVGGGYTKPVEEGLMGVIADPATYRVDPETVWERLKPRTNNRRMLAVLGPLPQLGLRCGRSINFSKLVFAAGVESREVVLLFY